MAFNVSYDSNGSFEKERVKPGTYQGICVAVHDLGWQTFEYAGEVKKQHKCVILWEINATMSGGEMAGRRFLVSKKYTVSLHEKSGLRKDLVSWRGRDFTDAELKGFDLESIIGVNCMLNLVATTGKNGNTYTQINAIMPLFTGLPKLSLENERNYKPKWVAEMQTAAPAEQKTVNDPFAGELTQEEKKVGDQMVDNAIDRFNDVFGDDDRIPF
jgi:hypothetical protein